MAGTIVAIDDGSSSVKVSVFKTAEEALDPQQLAEVEVGGITAVSATLKYTRGNHKTQGQPLKDVHD